MTEDEAQVWIATRYGVVAVDRLKRFVDLLVDENRVQNLIAPSTIPQIWVRHVVDSAQLLDLVPATWSTWLDVGTGGGFPGLVIAILAPDRKVAMVEPRRKRAEFLESIAATLSLPNASVRHMRVEALATSFDIISARAVAPLPKVLSGAAACAGKSTIWVLPRGSVDMTATERLRSLKSTMFHVEHSVTDPASAILVLEGTGR